MVKEGWTRLIDIVKSIEGLTPTVRQAYIRMAEIFEEKMPDSLYMNFYELSEITDMDADVWEQFLDLTEVNQFIKAKVAKLAEFEARKALNRLANDQLSSQDVQAVREILNSSKLLQQNLNQKPQVVLTFIPKTAFET